MAEKLLTDRACNAAKGKAKIYYKNDGNGLRLQVRPDGAKYWMLRYRWDGRETTRGLGPYGADAVTLDAARKRAAEERAKIAVGLHPTTAKRVAKAQRIEEGKATFGTIAAEWLKRYQGEWSGHHYERNKGLLDRILLPKLADLPVTEITEPMLLGVLLAAYDSGIKESARRARVIAQQVFAYARHSHRATHNPARELVGNELLRRPPVTPFAALKPKQVGAFLRKMRDSGTEPVTRAALLLMIYTGLRDSTLRAARWNEIDLKAGVWEIPTERRKSRRTAGATQFRVPLPRQAVTILKELSKITRTADDAYVFASKSKAGFLAENTLRMTLHRLGFAVTAHGFRSMLTDLLNERGFNPDAIERQLDHAEQDKTRGAYLRSEFFDYRRQMMQWLADWTDAQLAEADDPEIPGNVLAFRRVA
jgi:integrase